MTCAIPDCESPVENPQTGLCASCGHAARKALRESLKPSASKKPLKRVPLKKVSDKRKEQNTAYSVARLTWIIGKKCACCGDTASEVHHMKGRENDLLMEKKYWLPTCSGCHRLITDDSAWAIAHGYSLRRSN